VYPAGATVVQCNFHDGRDPTYRYYCTPPDQDGMMNELVKAVSSLSIGTSTPPSSRGRFPSQAPRARASMGFDVHRGTCSPSQTSSPGGGTKGRSKSAKDRIRVLGCVAISPDQFWAAGGEVLTVILTIADLKKGYTPRVLIYSTSTNNGTRTVPKVQALLEHSDGIRCMAFSPCSNYLVSVGTVHDQCIIVYKLTSKNAWVKIAAAKFKDIIDGVVWSKARIITVGRRHLRVWEWHENSVRSVYTRR
jgi:WD40 repeat protein